MTHGAAPTPGTIRVGVSGWSYPRWRGDFYPRGLVQRAELAYAAERMGSVEVNGSFYSLQRPSSYRSWREQTPDGFVLAVKGGRFITHLKRLRDVDVPLANFFASGVLALGPKLGPVLWQLPGRQELDAEVVASFLGMLPRTVGEAAALAPSPRRQGRRRPRPDAGPARPRRAPGAPRAGVPARVLLHGRGGRPAARARRGDRRRGHGRALADGRGGDE